METAASLALDANFQPIRILSVRDTIRYLVRDRARLVDPPPTPDMDVRTIVLGGPTVIRFLHFIESKGKKTVRFSRENVLIRDNWMCQYCGIGLTRQMFTIDHVVPRSQGGKSSFFNCVACCRTCNRRKANRTPEQARMKLRSKPSRPEFVPLTSMRIAKSADVPQSWLYWMGELDSE